jgi:hypothetical protein
MTKELTNYSILSGLAIGFISLIFLFLRKSRPAPKEGELEKNDDEQSSYYNKTIILNSLLVAILSGSVVYFVCKTLSNVTSQQGGSEIDQIMTGSAPF